jgi:hypothetical protein
MKKEISLILIAILALGVGIGYAAPMLIVPVDIQLYPHVPEGPKADFSVDIVYADFNTADYMYTEPMYNPDLSVNHTVTYPETNVSYCVVLNITNKADTPATLYEVDFAAAQDVTVHDSILGGTIYDNGFRSNQPGAYKHFGGITDGVYLDGKWVNTTWIPYSYYEENGTLIQESYPECLYRITNAYSSSDTVFSGPLTPYEVPAFSADHSINGTIPGLPSNASETGIWFEGIPVAEYYSLSGQPLITMMYVNGAWVDVTDRVTTNQTQPITTATNVLLNEVLTVGAQPYVNMNATVGPVTALPTWGSGGAGKTYFTMPWEWANQPFNNTFGPHESRLVLFNHTQTFIVTSKDDPPTQGLEALKTGNITLYASVSNYITNWPVNGTYYNTVSTVTQVKPIQLEQTVNGYHYNAILAANQTFQQGKSSLEVTVAPRTKP